MSANLILLTNTDGPVWQRAIGAYQVANHCRQYGITCQVIDFVNHFKIDELTEILKKFIGTDTLAIGVSTTFFYNASSKRKFVSADRTFETVISDEVRMLLEQVKAEYNLKIIAGGANSYQIQSSNDQLFDVIFHGYSEQSVVDYLQTLITGKRRLWPKVGNATIIDGAHDHFDIETLDHTWSINDCILPGETLPIEISRGCIFRCKFCSYPLNGKKKFDYLRDPERIKNELLENYRLYGTTNYFFTDDTFNDSTYKLERLHKVITELPFKIKFVTYLRLDLLHAHPEQIQLLYEMGLGSAFFGIETLHHESGKIIGKGLNPKIIKEFIIDLHDNHWKKEIPITASFIIGLPGESKESILETYNWCQTAPIKDLWFPLFIKSSSHFKSEFDLNFLDYGYTINDNDEWSNNHMTYQEALTLAEGFNNSGMQETQGPSTWFLFSLLSYGYSISELKDIAIKDLPWFSFRKKRSKMIKQYKQLLQTISEKI